MGKDGLVSKLIIKMADGIKNLTMKVEGINGKLPEHIVTFLFFVSHIFMLFFHEPWFDEAVAWLIAKDSSLYELLFVAPHYEGHPSLWHLVLSPFAKLGAPYELSLGLVSLVFSGLTVVLLIYKAPFKRIFRLLIPFTYFVFYQYSVVSRPYCMMMLAFVLMAMNYGKRNEHPGRFILSLWFLCLTSAYGLVIAGGICIVWLIEMFSESCKQSKTKNSVNGESRGALKIFFEDHLLKNGKLICLMGLLAYALFIIVRILPEADTYATLKKYDYGTIDVVKSILYSLFGSVSDLFVTNTFSSEGTLLYVSVELYELCVACAIGIAILVFIFIKARAKKMVLQFFVPLALFIAFMSMYSARHHIGIILLLIGYWAWIYTEKRPLDIKGAGINRKNADKLPAKDDKNPNRKKMLASVGVLLVAITFGVNLYWSLSSMILDVYREYSYGQQEYEFLDKYGLTSYNILADWEHMKQIDDGTAAITFSCRAVNILPYLSDSDKLLNTMYRLGRSYTYLHKVPTGEETDKLIDRILELNRPVVLLGTAPLMNIYESKEVNYNNYACVFKNECGTIWKGVPGMIEDRIYILNEFVEKLGLTELPK